MFFKASPVTFIQPVCGLCGLCQHNIIAFLLFSTCVTHACLRSSGKHWVPAIESSTSRACPGHIYILVSSFLPSSHSQTSLSLEGIKTEEMVSIAFFSIPGGLGLGIKTASWSSFFFFSGSFPVAFSHPKTLGVGQVWNEAGSSRAIPWWWTKTKAANSSSDCVEKREIISKASSKIQPSRTQIRAYSFGKQ